jgi:hypothetical protein
MANQTADQNPESALRLVYEKPSLHRLGLLRLVTRLSDHDDDDDHDRWEDGFPGGF